MVGKGWWLVIIWNCRHDTNLYLHLFICCQQFLCWRQYFKIAIVVIWFFCNNKLYLVPYRYIAFLWLILGYKATIEHLSYKYDLKKRVQAFHSAFYELWYDCSDYDWSFLLRDMDLKMQFLSCTLRYQLLFWKKSSFFNIVLTRKLVMY